MKIYHDFDSKILKKNQNNSFNKKTLKNKSIEKDQSFVLKRLGSHTWPNKKNLVRVGFARLEL
jgi:hypothetical protein